MRPRTTAGTKRPPADAIGWGAAALGGLAGGLAFDPAGLRALIPLAPAGLFLAAWNAATPRRAFRQVLVGGLIFYGVAISWLLTLVRYNAVAPVGVAVMALYMALYPALAAVIVRRWFTGLGPSAGFVAFAALWLLGEWFRTLGRLADPWTLLAHAWAPWPAAIQWAEFFGELGVSATVLVCAGAALAIGAHALKWRRAGRPERRSTVWAVSATAAAAALLAFSSIRERNWADRLAETPASTALRVALIQPNIDQMEKMASYMAEDAAVRGRLLREHEKLLEGLIQDRVEPGVDLIVTPESTFPALDFQFDQPLHRRIEGLLAPIGADAVFGAVRLVVDREGGIEEAYNSAYFLPAGEPVTAAAQQDKMRLVPFGEYIPYVGELPGVRALVGIADFNEGKVVRVFSTRGHGLAAMICFESSFSAQARRLTRAEAHLLAVITNDAWYGRSAGAAQHHHLARLRAVETRRPVARAANSGISSLIDPAGRLTATLPLGERGVILGTARPQTTLTFYVRWGNRWLVGLACGLIVGLGGATVLRRGRGGPGRDQPCA